MESPSGTEDGDEEVWAWDAMVGGIEVGLLTCSEQEDAAVRVQSYRKALRV
jgi:hypothetical protein